jgi:hypothetical protein
VRRYVACLALALLATVLAAFLGACSIGAGSSRSGGADLVVTRDFGARTIARGHEDPIRGSETVMRFLMRNANVDTRYSGRFVEAVNGTRSASEGGRRSDWFYYVNGIEADVGAADRDLAPGDRVWWDYHDWSAAMRVPAVVGSFPEPFLHGSDGKRFPVRIDCGQHSADVCDDVANRLERAGVDASTTAVGAATGKQVLRLVVGEWPEIRADGAANLLEGGPAKSGVYGRFGAAGGEGGSYSLDLLDSGDRVTRTLGPGAGLVAATRFEEQQPTWIVTGTDPAGLASAVRLLDVRRLRNQFAVATDGSSTIPLPVRPAS